MRKVDITWLKVLRLRVGRILEFQSFHKSDNILLITNHQGDSGQSVKAASKQRSIEKTDWNPSNKPLSTGMSCVVILNQRLCRKAKNVRGLSSIMSHDNFVDCRKPLSGLTQLILWGAKFLY